MRNIYNLNNGKLEVYSFNLLEEKAKIFRKKEMDSIPEDERVLDLIINRGWFTPNKNVIYECGAYVLRKSNNVKNENIINNHIINNLHYGRINIRERSDKEEDIVLLELLHLPTQQIQLTTPLANELLLDYEEFESEYLNLDELEELKEIYDISTNPVSTIDMKEIEKYYNFGLGGEDTFEEKNMFLEASTKVYEKLKSH